MKKSGRECILAARFIPILTMAAGFNLRPFA
jgi:hypothetical protein